MYLSYCCIIWGGATASVLKKLNSLQKRALRLITRSPYLSTSNPLFIHLNLLKIYDIYRLQTATFMFKLQHCLLPASCLQYCPVNQLRYLV